MNTFSLADFVQDRNPRMTQCGCRTRLAFEARYPPLVPKEFRWQYLERDLALQASILRQVNHSHAAGSELPQDAVLRYFLADHAGGNPLGQGMLGRVAGQVNTRHSYSMALDPNASFTGG